ncbi:prolyl oligopeptidase family serine peptidase [Lysobacter capsici]|uniref:S9 family peptidase n=1 Tax=Lysobacter capsici TaxID=435897 RepID=UPI0017820274|nr:S9 family peptidase [Lysobacter capsici]UOF14606.1 prolyl oligopeptidase family serine peptidase [Lysobacter capsici]
MRISFATLAALPLALLSTAAFAQAAAPLTLADTMANPDWIGPPVERAWWAWDGQRVQYQIKRDDGIIRDTWQTGVAGGTPQRLDGAARNELDAANPAYDAQRTRMAFVRNGDVFVRDLRSGALTQVTRSNDTESRPQFSRDGNLVFRIDNQWYQWRAGQGISQAAQVRAEKDPAQPPKADALRDYQLATIDTLRNDRAQRDAAREQDEAWRRGDGSRAPKPVYLGDEVEIIDSALSPDARWLLVVTQEKKGDAGTGGKMPKYVTESGYEEFEEVRTRVGRNDPLPQKLWLVDVANAKVSELGFDGLPGIKDDPLAALRKAAKQDPLKGERPVRIESDGDGSGVSIRWSDDGRHAAVLVRAIDNKDRWLTSVDLARTRLETRHRLTDKAWINWNFNDFGWLPDSGKSGASDLWLLSEQSGYSHLYLSQDGAAPRALTSGKWEVSEPELAADGKTFFFLCNRKWPGDYEVCAVDRNGGAVREVTALDGVENFTLSPDGRKVLARYSESYLPPQLAVVDAGGGDAVKLTDTRKPEFKNRQWIQPEYVQVPSKHGAGTVWGKFYGPKNYDPDKKYPIVMFVHGAGYLQNVSARYPNYFREQMFHNLLVDKGYVVLDLDYRASEGYGRDWRTAIYRQMGHPELEDYQDGLDWLVANKHGDRDRAGIYGGSYGGFMTFMALYRAPGLFKAGAALRPVSDWSQYNHEYTANILNTPELDPEAYKKSSPIEYAAGLKDNLLIAHGMIDDNVFFKDSVMMTQKLIELRKDKWEIAPYPLERHSFVHADAWYDEYRRIYELFERTLK